jgi:hypothetical protein
VGQFEVIVNIDALNLVTELLVPLHLELSEHGEQRGDGTANWPPDDGRHAVRTTWTARLSRHSTDADCAEIRHVVHSDRADLVRAWQAERLPYLARRESPQSDVLMLLRLRPSNGWPWLIDVREISGTSRRPMERRTTYQFLEETPAR